MLKVPRSGSDLTGRQAVQRQGSTSLPSASAGGVAGLLPSHADRTRDLTGPFCKSIGAGQNPLFSRNTVWLVIRRSSGASAGAVESLWLTGG